VENTSSIYPVNVDASTSHGKENPDDVPESFHVAEQVGTAIHVGEMEMFSVAYVSGFIAKQLLHHVDCAACKASVTSQVMTSNSVLIYFKEYSGTKQPVTSVLPRSW
jgi:hypothetical protein